MGKKKKGSTNVKKQNLLTDKPFKCQLRKKLVNFIASKDDVYTFEANLNPAQRSYIHMICRNLRLKSKSSGPADHRVLSVCKVKQNEDADKQKSLSKKGGDADKQRILPMFTIAEEPKRVLMDLFTFFPPNDNSEAGDMIGSYHLKADNVKTFGDTIFRKTTLSKVQIAKKIQLLFEKKGALRQITDTRSFLPIASFKNVITQSVKSNQVVIVCGETGCGKTTQVPQYLLEDIWGQGMTCKIVCTQPRRISAISVAERVAQERGEIVGNTVGYKIRFEKKGGRNSSIVFCTNGIFLKILVSSGVGSSNLQASDSPRSEFSDLTHIIMDEIHERDCYSDMILAILRDALPLYPNMRLVLMSATIDIEKLVEYFHGCPVIRVPGFMHAVKAFYLDDIHAILKMEKQNHLDSGTELEPNESRNHLDGAIDLAAENDEAGHLLEIVQSDGTTDCSDASALIDAADPESVDVVLIQRLLKKICTDSIDGAVLVFLPGWDEISRVRKKLLTSSDFLDPSKFVIHCLHSKVPASEQRKVFVRPSHGRRKIILSTNIAETSVTIDDVVYVVDTGRMKERSYDPSHNVSTLESTWVSKSSARQRQGRAGRCRPGFCYRLYSKQRAGSFPEHPIPELLRMPIDNLCLQAKLINRRTPIKEFLDKMMDRPSTEVIQRALELLINIGALTDGEDLTDLGERLGLLPVQPSKSKMLLFSIMMDCLEPALVLTCASEIGDMFAMCLTPQERARAAAAKSAFSSLYGSSSDQLATVAAFECWKAARRKGTASHFCEEYSLSPRNMETLALSVRQLRTELTDHGFITRGGDGANARDPGIVRAVLVAGLYPNLGRLVRNKKTPKAFVETPTWVGDRVCLGSSSVNAKPPLTIKDSSPPLMIVYNEIHRGDSRALVRDCTVVGPLPVMLIGADIAVAGSCGELPVMLDAANSVEVVIDRWLSFETTALDIALIYCLRERLSAAVLFSVKYPSEPLPHPLAESVRAASRILSCDWASSSSVDDCPVRPVLPAEDLTRLFGAETQPVRPDGPASAMVGPPCPPPYHVNGGQAFKRHRGNASLR